MKITKRPKGTIIRYSETKCYTSTYHCPSCRTVYSGYGIGQKVTRFICSCGQELRVVERIYNWNDDLFEECADLDALAKAQGVQPVDDIGKLKIDGYDE